jgi:hypothetical protein
MALNHARLPFRHGHVELPRGLEPRRPGYEAGVRPAAGARFIRKVNDTDHFADTFDKRTDLYA